MGTQIPLPEGGRAIHYKPKTIGVSANYRKQVSEAGLRNQVSGVRRPAADFAVVFPDT
jgi:hypothetical protein